MTSTAAAAPTTPPTTPPTTLDLWLPLEADEAVVCEDAAADVVAPAVCEAADELAPVV